MSLAHQLVKVAAGAVDVVRRPRDGLVILLYHRVGATTGVSVDLPTDLFDAQMAAIAESGAALGLDEAVAGLAAGVDLAGSVVVTFDDGTVDLLHRALPVLERHRVPATVYVATDFVERGVRFPDDGVPLSWAGLAEARSTGLLTVGSHTHTHALLDRLEAPAVVDELDRSIDLIEDRLGVRVDHFAYPKAIAPTAVAEGEVRRRFRSAALARTRANPVPADLHRLSRSPIQVHDGLRWFGRKLAGGMALEDDLRRLVDRRRHAGAST